MTLLTALSASSKVIDCYDFSKILDHAVRENPSLKLCITSVLEEYKMYILEICETGGTHPVPSKEVDALWHSHILHTKEYRHFCELLRGPGKFIEHVPSMSGSCYCSDNCYIDVSCSGSCSSDD